MQVSSKKDHQNIKIPKNKIIKIANCFAVGGMIGLGKSTLVDGLSKRLNATAVFELDENDKVQQMLLSSMYEGKRSQSPDTFQIDFLLTRVLRYKKKIALGKLVIFDRTIFEDLIFAHQNMAKVPHRYHYYQNLWANEVNALVYTYGIPKKYILLDADFEVFKKRLFARNRQVETKNYEQNEHYFKSLNKLYISFMKGILEEYGIEYQVIDASQSKEKVLSQSLKFLMDKPILI